MSGSGGTLGGSGGTSGGSGGSTDAGTGDAPTDGGPTSDCPGVEATAPGWVQIEARVEDLGGGPMESPILRCEREPGRLTVLAAGNEQDGVDYTMMRVEIASGYTGPGT